MPRQARLDTRQACPDLAGPRLSAQPACLALQDIAGRWRAGSVIIGDVRKAPVKTGMKQEVRFRLSSAEVKSSME